ncbi:ROK family protein [Termitidicoccus mucosus]|jgi:glucokinase|uniref:ROK family protein n=1 Tax=Termitidicoccus mucosus TaxID=1184151 RepID=UPI0008381418
MNFFGLDIGGTKCAVSRLRPDGSVEETHRITTGGAEGTIGALLSSVATLAPGSDPVFGISCGGPLDLARGLILSPPNLPGWDRIPITETVTRRFGGRAVLMNDANASALAEWRFGAGRGCRHMVFLTSGTGMGAGLILNGQLYEGASGDAGEVGHIRLSDTGPVGFGKAGSFEGFCSGGGIPKLAAQMLGSKPMPAAWLDRGAVSTRAIAGAALAGDMLSLRVLEEAGRYLGKALSILIDTLNPERIVIGGIFPRCQALLEPAMRAELEHETLPTPLASCHIAPAELGETIGSHGAISAALHAFPAVARSLPNYNGNYNQPAASA